VKTVRIADLRNNLSRHLTRVRAGADVIVYDRDTPVARIVPFDAPRAAAGGTTRHDPDWTTERLGALERRGTIAREAARGMAEWIAGTRPIVTPKGTKSAVETLLRARRESKR
jgi:antitoxin (DNA-binding transcriptional repressor) of toxin-antitoxin stability system